MIDNQIMDNQIMDNQIIVNREYELDILKGKICVVCKDNFHYVLHKRKEKIKRKDFAYYMLYNNIVHYLHEYCLNALFLKYIDEHGKLNIDQELVKQIILYDRYGKQMTKTNYIKSIDSWLKSQVFERFCTHVSHMYTIKEHFSFHCTDYIFDDTYLDAFNLAKNTFNYKGRHVDNDLQPDRVGGYLSR